MTKPLCSLLLLLFAVSAPLRADETKSTGKQVTAGTVASLKLRCLLSFRALTVFRALTSV